MDKRIKSFQKKEIYFGTSSWKYDGWKGLVYNKNYKSEKEFQVSCLEEYADEYTTVGVDHTFYQWPYEKTIDQYMKQTPKTFLFGFKATEKITIFKYPKFKRYGKEAGKTNPDFLNAKLFRENFLHRLRPHKKRVGPIMLEFSRFFPGMLPSGSEFVERLNRFFGEVDDPDFQLAVEIRNNNWIAEPYFKMLSKNGVAHVFNSWTKMPPIGDQLDVAKDFALPCYVSRLLLEPGVTYEKAVESYEPYNKIQKKQPAVRKDTVGLIQHALKTKKPAYVFVNNRCEGCAPLTILGILDLFKNLP